MGRGKLQTHFAKASLPGNGVNKRATKGNTKAHKGNIKKGSSLKNSNASTKMSRCVGDVSKGSKAAGGQTRDKATVKRLALYKAKGPTSRQLHTQELKPARIEPDRRWFGNTRVVTQGKMEDFRYWLNPAKSLLFKYL